MPWRLPVRSRFRLASVALILPFALAACAEAQLAAQAAKTIQQPTVKTQGYYKVGDPYEIRGVWYYPTVDYNYIETGIASWYGPGFHGKLTANGEIYDENDLTAAHRTLPMPSLVRVTNLENGRSLVVRVNDRGPFAHGRIIDLSRRAAELLDYTHSGLAKVDVEYLGRAPLHGQDDEFLMASYRPAGGRGPDPSDGMPSGVMIAMNGPTPSRPVAAGAAVPFPVQPRLGVPTAMASADFVLPDFGPLVPERPNALARLGEAAPLPALSYADRRIAQAARALGDFAGPQAATEELAAALNKRHAAASVAPAAPGGYVVVGTYADQPSAEAVAARLREAGRAEIETDWSGDAFTLNLYPDGRRSLDGMLQAAWRAGASDAMPVRE